MFSTLVCAFFGAYIPWKLRKQGGSKGASFISNGAMLSGGVFVGVGFLHLLGDAVEDMQSFKHSHHGYPFSMLCASVGFLFTLCIDELGHALAHSTAVLRLNGMRCVPTTKRGSRISCSSRQRPWN